jgi:hypothetical protein
VLVQAARELLSLVFAPNVSALAVLHLPSL